MSMVYLTNLILFKLSYEIISEYEMNKALLTYVTIFFCYCECLKYIHFTNFAITPSCRKWYQYKINMVQLSNFVHHHYMKLLFNIFSLHPTEMQHYVTNN